MKTAKPSPSPALSKAAARFWAKEGPGLKSGGFLSFTTGAKKTVQTVAELQIAGLVTVGTRFKGDVVVMGPKGTAGLKPLYRKYMLDVRMMKGAKR